MALGAIVAGLVLYNVRLSASTSAALSLQDDNDDVRREPTEMDDVASSTYAHHLSRSSTVAGLDA